MGMATFNASLEGLRQLLGLPPEMRIVRIHTMPNQYGADDGVRLVVESPAIPDPLPGEEIPFVVASYDLRGAEYRRFNGFKLVTLAAEEQAGNVDDGL